MIIKKGYPMQSIHIVKTKCQPAQPKVAAFTGKVVCNKYSRAVWNSMSREQQMQVRQLHEQQGIKLIKKYTSAKGRLLLLRHS